MNTLDTVLTALAHPARRHAMRVIDGAGEICLCEILAEIDVPQPNMSRHMAMLRRAGLIVDRRDSRRVLYRRNVRLEKDILRMVDAVLKAAGDEITTGERKEVAA